MKMLKEFILFLMERKKWWLVPVLVTFMIIGILLIFASTSAVTPFIYTLF